MFHTRKEITQVWNNMQVGMMTELSFFLWTIPLTFFLSAATDLQRPSCFHSFSFCLCITVGKIELCLSDLTLPMSEKRWRTAQMLYLSTCIFTIIPMWSWFCCSDRPTLNCIAQQLGRKPFKDQFPPTIAPLSLVLSTQFSNFAIHPGSPYWSVIWFAAILTRLQSSR